MSARTLETQPATTYFLESGDAVYVAFVAESTACLVRQMGSGQLVVASCSVIGSGASVEVDLRPWEAPDRLRILSELTEVLTVLLEQDLSPGGRRVLTDLGGYASRVMEHSS